MDNTPFNSPEIVPLDVLLLTWRQTALNGQVFEFIFILEDNSLEGNLDTTLLSSQAIPTEIDFALASGRGIGFNIFFGDPRTRQQWDFLNMVVTGFVIEALPQPISSLLQQLLTDSTGIGPGKSLANKVMYSSHFSVHEGK